MRRLFPTLRASAAVCLLLAGSASFAASPALTDDPLASLQAAYARSVMPGEEADLYTELFATALNRIERSYATDVDLSALVAAAMKAMEPLPPGAGKPAEVFKKALNEALRTLDPYSRYLDPRTHSNERSSMSGSFGGLGLEVESSDGAVRVVAPMPGSPAARAGLKAGDFIVRVDDQPLLGVPLAEAVSRMRGQPGTPVSMTIRRSGIDHEFTVSVTRDTIRRQAMHWSMEGDVLVLRLGTFMASSAAALQQAIAEATAANLPRGVVLDMRGNPGGLLREAVLTADAFLSKGDIVSLRGRTLASQRTRQADATEFLAGVPMVVLIDGRSASAAELVAAALQENGRATVMGQRSFGKGSVQATYPLGEHQGALKLTTSFYHGPSGRSVHRTGVAPDIELVTSSRGDRPRGEAAPAQALSEANQPQAPLVRVEQGRCSSLRKGSDPALSCAVAYLLAENIDGFLATLAD